MNFKLAREIYGLTPWMMDVHSIPVMSSILGGFKNGTKLETPEVKLNTPFVYEFDAKEQQIITRPWQLEGKTLDFEGVGVIKIDGAITKNGGESSFGMLKLSSMMRQMAKDKRIKSFVILTDSGGGSSSAVNIMIDAINEIKKTHSVIGLVEKGGLAASAAYGILTACHQIFSEDENSIIGSVGTMIQFQGREANTVDNNGVKHIRLYATKSTKKNQGFEDAFNKDNYEILINDLLDPINEAFIKMVSKNRPEINAIDFESGKTYFAKNVVGTYIDGIKSLNEVIQMSLNQKVNTEKTNGSRTKTNKKMITKSEFKIENPEAYNAIFQKGVASEKDRVGAWLAHIDTDAKAVSEGIKSGKKISQTQREAFFVKQNSLNLASNMQDESTQEIVTPESKGIQDLNKEHTEKAIQDAFDFDLN